MDEIKSLLLTQIKNGNISKSRFDSLSESSKTLLYQKNEKYYLKPEARAKIKVVLSGGVFDVLHIGHIITLFEAKNQGDILVVAIANDEYIKKKGREPIHPQEYRRMMVESLKPVDLALSGFDDPNKMIEQVSPDVIVYGYDQKEFATPKGVKIVKLDKKIDEEKFKSNKIIKLLGF